MDAEATVDSQNYRITLYIVTWEILMIISIKVIGCFYMARHFSIFYCLLFFFVFVFFFFFFFFLFLQ